MNRTSWIIIGVTALIMIGITAFFLYPNTTEALRTVGETQNVKKELADLSKKHEILTKLSKNNQLSNLYDIASKYIPENQSSSELIIELTAMANQANMKVEQVSLDTGTTKNNTANPDTTETDSSKTTPSAPATPPATKSLTPNLSELKFSLKLSGNFSDFLTFLKSTETSSRLISFNTMSLSQEKDSFSAQISGLAYYKQGTSLENTLDNIQITDATINKFLNLKTFGVPINLPTESGFGRTNPFDAVKP